MRLQQQLRLDVNASYQQHSWTTQLILAWLLAVETLSLAAWLLLLRGVLALLLWPIRRCMQASQQALLAHPAGPPRMLFYRTIHILLSWYAEALQW